MLTEHCYACHSRGVKKQEAGLSLDTRAGILAGGDNGPIIKTDKPEESPLLEAVRYDGDTQMPPDGKLEPKEIALLEEWVRRGAPLPADGSATVTKQGIDFAAGRKFWSFQPLRKTAPPQLRDASRARGPIDVFMLGALEQRGLEPTAQADARTLIRRATFDLVGLPPTPEETEQFVQETAREPADAKSPSAYDKLIDRLLASPHYGERWGRYWLDLSRYADANKTSLEVRDRAWLYRDWIVGALNRDVPYDEFVVRQLAGDQLPGNQPADLAALGFLGVSPEYFKELKLSPTVIKSIVADEWEERIDALGRTFLGLSVACARCHDHKFDPIGADDYYALAGILASTRLMDRWIVPDAEAVVVQKAREEVLKLEAQIKPLKAMKMPSVEDKAKIAELESRIKEIERGTPRYDSAMAHVVDDAALFVEPNGPDNTKLVYKPNEAIDLPLQIRGNPMKPGHVVPRRFLTVLSSETPQPFRRGSGRLDLAQAIVGQAAPLSGRVIVNRVWAHHFGRGLVDTLSDFGTQGERPSHPELLDDLTLRFIENGWSLKWLHREIMKSAAYRQASTYDPKKFAADPDNRLLWRMNRQRLDIEAWRDSVLASCGNLDRTLGGPSVALTSLDNHRRTMYGKIDRSDVDDMLRLFDFPDTGSHAPSRIPTTTALQQLFVLNSPFIVSQAATLAKRLAAESPQDAPAIVRRAYRLLFARLPSDNELRLGIDFLTTGDSGKKLSPETVQEYAQALLGSNEFSFVD
ncbi:MAG: PSD1 and planctomycete cytochrome C domain-containing protein [Planctomycetia bacterium]|nr:PSD1 and planctomycete cytochrome C domain-containing protein [Planctomycetia bacterium]